MEEPILNAHNKEEYPPMHTAEQVAQLEAAVNEVIGRHLDVTIEFMPREQAPISLTLANCRRMRRKRSGLCVSVIMMLVPALALT